MEVSTLNNIDFTGPGRNIMRSYFCLKRLARNIKTVENMNYGGIAMNFLTYDMKQLIGDLVDTVEHFFPGKVSFEVQSSSLKPIYADVDDVRICEVILNLIVNSLQHARDAKDANARITVTLKPTRDIIIITVADNCGGMSDHALSRAFSKFSTDGDLSAMAEGAGLGLAVCKGLVEAHGGALVIESHEGKGTLTRISVPVHTKGILRSQKFLLENNDMKFILTELSVILGNEFFDLKYLD
jgi:two-component system sensor histidine kinase KdpD